MAFLQSMWKGSVGEGRHKIALASSSLVCGAQQSAIKIHPPVTGPAIKAMAQMTGDSVSCGHRDGNLFLVFPSGISAGTGKN